MNNYCNRKCTWNYDGQCCPEDGTHYEDGTAYTKNCSEFLVGKYESNFVEILDQISKMLGKMNYKKLKKARYLLQNVDQGLIGLNKQIPKKPIQQGYRDSDHEKIGNCWTCKGWWMTKYYKYCPNCGQKLDWEE